MKRIVALVLSLVMILGLATTAFGATAIVINSALNAPEGATIEKLPDGTLIALVPDEEPAASATTETGSATIESAKTFDAGVAMYAAMSVMAAAGSVVVLKKTH